MSLLTDHTSLSSIIQPSLVYPSLPRRKHNSYHPAPLFHRYRSIDADDEVSSQDESVINNNTKELQTCIHFASRLIKLRSELRSPSYMKTRPTSMQKTYSDYFQQQHYNEDIESTTNKSQTLSEVGRVQSLPNVSEFSSSHNEHPYYTKKFINFCEDESEIISLNSNSTDEASQLTYLTELVRRGNTSKIETLTHHHLSLPPKHLSSEQERRRLSSTPSSTFKKNHRSLSLRDMIHEVIDEGMNNNKGDDKKIVQPIKRERFSSLALASQLLYASQSTEEKENKEVDFYREKTEINEGEPLLLQQQHVKKEEDAPSEKVEIKEEKPSMQSKFLKSLNKQQDRSLNSDEKKVLTKTITPAAIICPPPKASLSRDTNKSLFSTLSSDSESEEENSSHHSSSVLFSKPATVAKSRRNHQKQQAVRTKLAEVYAAKERTL
ncbi:unnamed protein product [Mucor hiemalis]